MMDLNEVKENYIVQQIKNKDLKYRISSVLIPHWIEGEKALWGFVKCLEMTDHSLQHAKSVFELTAEFLKNFPNLLERMNDGELFCLVAATWLHDVGLCGYKEVRDPSEVRRTHGLLSARRLKDSEQSHLFWLESGEIEPIMDLCIYHQSKTPLTEEQKEHLGEKALVDKVIVPEAEYKYGNKSFRLRMPLLASILSLSDACDVQYKRMLSLAYTKVKMEEVNWRIKELEQKIRRLRKEEEEIEALKQEIEHLKEQENHWSKDLSVSKVWFKRNEIVIKPFGGIEELYQQGELERALKQIQGEIDRSREVLRKFGVHIERARLSGANELPPPEVPRLTPEEKRWFEELGTPSQVILTSREEELKQQLQEHRCLIIHGPPGVGKSYQIYALKNSSEVLFLKLKSFNSESEDNIRGLLSGISERAENVLCPLFLIIDETYHGGAKFDGEDVKAFMASNILSFLPESCKIIIGVRTNTYKEILDRGLLPEDTADIEITGLPPDALNEFVEKLGIKNWLEEYNQALDKVKLNPYVLFLLSRSQIAKRPLKEISDAIQPEILEAVYRSYCYYGEKEREVLGAMVAMDEYFGLIPQSLLEGLWKEMGYDPRKLRHTLRGLQEDGLVTYQEKLILGSTLELNHDLLYQTLREKASIVEDYRPAIEELYRKLVDETYRILKDISEKGMIMSFDIYKNLFYYYYLYITREGTAVLRRFEGVKAAIGDYLSEPHPKMDEAYHISEQLFYTLSEKVLKLGEQGQSLFDDLGFLTESIIPYFDSKHELYTKIGYWYTLGWMAETIGRESKDCCIKSGEILELLVENALKKGNDKEAYHLSWRCAFSYWRGKAFDKAGVILEKAFDLGCSQDIEIETLTEIACRTAISYEEAYKTEKQRVDLRDKAIEYYIKAADLRLKCSPMSWWALKLYKKALDLLPQEGAQRGSLLGKVKKMEEKVKLRSCGSIPVALVANEFDEMLADKVALHLTEINPPLKPEFISPDKIKDIFEVINSYPIGLVFGAMAAPSTGKHVRKLVLQFPQWKSVGRLRGHFYLGERHRKRLYDFWVQEVNGHLFVLIAGEGWEATKLATEKFINDESIRERLRKLC